MDTLTPRRIRRTGDDTPARSLLGYIWRLSGRHQIALCLGALVIAALSMAPLELQKTIVNEAIEGRDIGLLLTLGGLYVGVLTAQLGLKYGFRLYQSWISQSAIRYTRLHLIGLKARQAGSATAGIDGEAVPIITAEVEKLGGFVGEGLSEPVANAGMVLALSGYMLAVEPLVALFCLPFLLAQLAIVPVIQRVLNRLIAQRVEATRRIGDELTRAGGGEAASRQPIDRVYGVNVQLALWKQAQKSATNALSSLGPLSALLVGGYFVIQGQTTVGVVVAFMTGFERLAEPIRDLISHYRVTAQTVVQHRLIAEWM